jgi:polyferredoxin
MALEAVPKAVGLVYTLVLIGVLAYLWYSGRWRHWIGWLALVVSAALGFLAGMLAPYQFQLLVLRDVQGLGGPLIVGVVALAIMLVLTILFGRFFCGYACPVGAVQEIAYHAPVPKLRPRQKAAFMVVRGVLFAVFLIMAFVFSASLLAWFGINDFFSLALTAGSAVFIVVLLVSLVFYRPFCRLVCPYGFVLSFGGALSRLRIRRTAACIECGKCETACPADEAKRDDAKAECYLCGRCTEVCPKGALVYGRPLDAPEK